MDISIVIPAYNCHKTIERTINSILDAKYKNTLEILLIDDCSKENFSYLKEIYRHENINIIRNKSNLGQEYLEISELKIVNMKIYAL